MIIVHILNFILLKLDLSWSGVFKFEQFLGERHDLISGGQVRELLALPYFLYQLSHDSIDYFKHFLLNLSQARFGYVIQIILVCYNFGARSQLTEINQCIFIFLKNFVFVGPWQLDLRRVNFGLIRA